MPDVNDVRERERQTKVKNLDKRGWHNSVKTRERIVQVNLLKTGKSISISKRKKCK